MNTYPIPLAAQKVIWPHVSLDSLPWFLGQFLPETTPKVILTADSETAWRLREAWAFFRPNETAVFFPDWETLPYERFSPHHDLISERLSVLWQLKNGWVDALFVPVGTAMQRLAPISFLLGHTFWLKVGQSLDVQAFRHNALEAGYVLVDNVIAAGEFAVRGGIVDVFPMGSPQPYRLDMFGDEIDSIKTFDPDTQRTQVEVAQVRLLPAHEFPTDVQAQTIFRQNFRQNMAGDPTVAAVYNAVGNGQFGAGVKGGAGWAGAQTQT